MSPVYREFDQATLDREYSPSSCSEDIDQYVQRYVTMSGAFYRDNPGYQECRYGPSEAETLDLFFPPNPVATDKPPLHIFIHGGYWQQLSKSEFVFMGKPFLDQGIAFASLNYVLAPQGDMDEIVAQCRRAIAWAYKNEQELPYDSSKIVLSGHSAGAHLAMMAAATDWQVDYGIEANPIHGIVALSGLYDLEPIRLSYVNEPLQLDAESVRRNSPLNHLPEQAAPVCFAYGERETAEFKRQTEAYFTAWCAQGLAAEKMEIPARDHFDLLFEMIDPSSPLFQMIGRVSA